MVQPMPDNPLPPACPPTNLAGTVGVTENASLRQTDRGLVVPEIEETAEVTTRMIETGVVRISKHVHDVERTFHPTLHDERIRVERVPVNRVVKNPPEIRTEGNTTVIPIVEEVMVKLLLLKEEVRVTREVVDKPSEPQHVTLRREEVIVERHPAEAAAVAGLGRETAAGPSCPPGTQAAPTPPPIPRHNP
jgi:stress response protein YsnF